MKPLILLLVLLAAAVPAAAQTAFFNDPTDTIEADGQSVLGTAATYEAVVLFPSDVGAVGNIFNEWTNFQEDKYLAVSPTALYGYNHPLGGGVVLRADTTLTPDVWHHVAFVCDGAEERLYLDGGLVASMLASGDVGDGAGLAHVGAIFRDGTVHTSFIGSLESIRISDVARYTGSTFDPPLGDLDSDANTLLLYNFDESAGSPTVHDESPLNRTGTLAAGFGGATPPELGMSPVATEPDPAALPAFALNAPSPNPADGRTTLAYDVAEAGRVRLAVFDALGREVALLADGPVTAGRHEAVLDGARLAAGVYLVRMTAEGGFMRAQRVTIVR